ncbi:predicted protein [Chaetoceros tenuissimus]|uniref:Uncharacterized protein n=1 Tax=Chaetoceros tenuissimus TaxID=426638 RepID=A0AAD3H4U6_9STRA|nr:predicted protein [Chaetoceros tenuissimus]
MRRKFPELEESPYFVLFLIVVFSGGECPKEIDFLYSSEQEEEGSMSDWKKKSSSPKHDEQDESFLDEYSSYEKFLQELLGESMISNDSLFKLFYAKNPVKDPKSHARQFSKSNTPDDSQDESLGQEESRINNVSYALNEESFQYYKEPRKYGTENEGFEL